MIHALILCSALAHSDPVKLTVFSSPGTAVDVEQTSDFQDWVPIATLPGGSKPLELILSPTNQTFYRASEAPSLPFGFNNYEPSFRDTTWRETPYFEASPFRLPDTFPQDSKGVRQYVSEGVLYDHPVYQSMHALSMVNSYLLATNPAYVARARLHCDRLIETSVESRGAWWLPYRFRFPLEFNYDHIEPPWFSGMAQGVAITAILRVYDLTGDERYRSAADKYFESFKLRAGTNGEPWFVTNDDRGNLWFEEYAQDPNRGDYVFNGHIYALLGVYDYWRATGDPAAFHLAQGAVTTIRNRMSDLRTPGFYAKYCVRHNRQMQKSYQGLHTMLLSKLYSLTGDPFFAKAADDLMIDAPAKSGGTGMFSGVADAFKFDTFGNVITIASNAFPVPVELPVSERDVIRNNTGTWLKIAEGELMGFWVRETPLIYLKGITQIAEFNPARSIKLIAGVDFRLFKFSPGGSVIDSKVHYFQQPHLATFDARAIINGRQYIRLSSGLFSGYWTQATHEMVFD